MPLFGPPNIEKMKAKRDVQGLIKALSYPKDADVRDAAAGALAEIKDAQAVEPLIAALKDSDIDMRKAAAISLDKLKNTQAVEPLISVLKDKREDISVRRLAAKALGNIGDIKTVESFIAGLEDRNWLVRGNAAESLGMIRDVRAVDPLIATLKDNQWSVRKNAAEALGLIGDIRAVEPLISTLKDSVSDVREAVANALGEIGDMRAFEPLLAAGENSSSAVVGLAKLGNDRAVKVLVARLNSSDLSDRRFAAENLVAIYQSGRSDESTRRLILDRRSYIMTAHDDKEPYNNDSRCTEQHVDTPHRDYGIGVDFPL